MGTKYNVDNSGNITAVNSVKITTGTPPAASKGAIYYDTTADQVKVSTDGSTFASMSQYKGGLATDPTSPAAGDMWFNTATQTTKLATPSANSYYYGAAADELSAPITGLTFTNATAFTICFWVRLSQNSQPEPMMYFANMSGGTTGNYRWSAWFDGRDTGGAYRYPNKFVFSTDKFGTDTYSVSSTTLPSDNTWYWYCATYDGANNMALYVNNVSEATGSYGGGAATSVALPIKTFNTFYSTGTAGNFYIQDWRLYTSVISATTRAMIYNGGLGTSTTTVNSITPVRHYKYSGTNGYTDSGSQAVNLQDKVGTPVPSQTQVKISGVQQTGASSSEWVKYTSGTFGVASGTFFNITSLPERVLWKLVMIFQGDSDAANIASWVYFNGDTGNNYSYQSMSDNTVGETSADAGIRISDFGTTAVNHVILTVNGNAAPKLVSFEANQTVHGSGGANIIRWAGRHSNTSVLSQIGAYVSGAGTNWTGRYVLYYQGDLQNI